jgi:hypothetical protein
MGEDPLPLLKNRRKDGTPAAPRSRPDMIVRHVPMDPKPNKS